ncbi:hypothetical protein [Acidocella aminolytica]|nr:hypothetical protein [Acidocella aminolytica]
MSIFRRAPALVGSASSGTIEMDASACPNSFEAYYTPACGNAGLPAAPPSDPITPVAISWHMVPLSPTATQLVLVLLTILLATLLASKPQK